MEKPRKDIPHADLGYGKQDEINISGPSSQYRQSDGTYSPHRSTGYFHPAPERLPERAFDRFTGKEYNYEREHPPVEPVGRPGNTKDFQIPRKRR